MSAEKTAAAKAIGASDPYPDTGYDQRYRPQFHFTSKCNWINDPNGCVYYDGEYHMFFQHNAGGTGWGPMSWGHAVSADLVHWRQLPHAIRPDELGTIFSGSAVVDENNTSGFGTGDEKPIVAAFTYAGGNVEPNQPFTQALAYSTDRGRTMTKYEHNPVVVNQTGGDDRDPKLLWHEDTSRWVMVLYLDSAPRRLCFFTSPDLKTWTKQSEIDGFYECPDLFELPVDGDASDSRWVLLAADGNYVMGRFDGVRFHREAGKFVGDYGGNFYASQSFSNTPDGRRIQIGWMNGASYPDMPFNQQMSFPCELGLRSTPDGVRLFRAPVREIESLYDSTVELADLAVSTGSNPLADVAAGELFDVELALEPRQCSRFGLSLFDQDIECTADAIKCLGHRAPLPVDGGVVRLRVLVDRTSIEVFAGDGAVSMTTHFLPKEQKTGLSLFASDGEAHLVSAKVRTLRSAWL